MGYGKGPGPLRTLQGEVGFTLMELLLSLFLFALIAGVILQPSPLWSVGWRKVGRDTEIIALTEGLLHMAQEVRRPCRLRRGDMRFRAKKCGWWDRP
jgi:hypothetical protein